MHNIGRTFSAMLKSIEEIMYFLVCDVTDKVLSSPIRVMIDMGKYQSMQK